MKSEIKEIKEAIKNLSVKDRRGLLGWASQEFKGEYAELESYATEVWDAMARGILKATYIDIRERCQEHEFVMYRSLVLYHIYTDWVEGSSTIMIGRIANLSHATVTYHIKNIKEALNSDRRIPIWKEYHEANDMVMTIFNNYINQ